MNQVFVKLLEVRIWHDYVLLEDIIPEQLPLSYNIKELLTVLPSKRTEQLLRAYNLIFKPTPAGFLIVARVEEGEALQTFTRFDKREKFSFFLQIKHPGFTIFTNQSLSGQNSHLYYFTNLEANTLEVDGRTLNYVSKALPGFDPEQVYEMGELVREQGSTFEVINIPVNEAPVSGLTQDTWAEGKNTQYISGLDRVRYVKGVYRFDGANQAPGEEVLFSVRNQFGDPIDLGTQNIPGEEIPMGKAVYPNDPDVNLRHSLFLAGKEEGLYSLLLDEEQLNSFYLMPAREVNNPLGVIDLFYTPPTENEEIPTVPEDFGFIDPGPDAENPLSTPTGIVYNLHFKSRMTFRRYISGDQVRTHDRPLPLNKAFAGVEIDGNKMPEPDLMSIKREVDEVDNQTREKYFSIIYSN